MSELLNRIRSKKTRSDAIAELAQADSSDIRAFFQEAASGDRVLRGAVEDALAVLGRLAVGPLRALLGEESAKIREWAVRQIEVIGCEAKEALPDLIRLHQDDPSIAVRRAAVDAFALMGPEAYPSLLMAHWWNHASKRTCMDTIRHIRRLREELLPLILEMMREGSIQYPSEALWAYPVEIMPEVIQALLKHKKDERFIAAACGNTMYPNAFPPKILEEDCPSKTIPNCIWPVLHDSERDGFQPKDLMGVCIEWLGREDLAHHLAALIVLGNMAPGVAVEALPALGRMLSEGNPAFRALAALLLVRFGEKSIEWAPVLVRCTRSGDEFLTRYSIYALDQLSQQFPGRIDADALDSARSHRAQKLANEIEESGDLLSQAAEVTISADEAQTQVTRVQEELADGKTFEEAYDESLDETTRFLLKNADAIKKLRKAFSDQSGEVRAAAFEQARRLGAHAMLFLPIFVYHSARDVDPRAQKSASEACEDLRRKQREEIEAVADANSDKVYEEAIRQVVRKNPDSAVLAFGLDAAPAILADIENPDERTRCMMLQALRKGIMDGPYGPYNALEKASDEIVGTLLRLFTKDRRASVRMRILDLLPDFPTESRKTLSVLKPFVGTFRNVNLDRGLSTAVRRLESSCAHEK